MSIIAWIISPFVKIVRFIKEWNELEKSVYEYEQSYDDANKKRIEDEKNDYEYKPSTLDPELKEVRDRWYKEAKEHQEKTGEGIYFPLGEPDWDDEDKD